MSRRKRAAAAAAAETPPAFHADPFAALSAKALGLTERTAAAPAPAAASGPVAPAPAAPVLSQEDRELLKVFGNAGIAFRGAPAAAGSGAAAARGRVRLQVQRKGKGGKTVTRVLGLEELGLAEQMELARSLRQALGTGAHFDEGVLELHGDLRERAAAWFRQNRFVVL